MPLGSSLPSLPLAIAVSLPSCCPRTAGAEEGLASALKVDFEKKISGLFFWGVHGSLLLGGEDLGYQDVGGHFLLMANSQIKAAPVKLRCCGCHEAFAEIIMNGFLQLMNVDRP